VKVTKCALAMVLGLMALATPTKVKADGVDYTINFTTTSGSPSPTSGSFTYDSTTDQFTNFIVDWDNLEFDLTASANAPANFGAPTGCSGASLPGYGFLLMSQAIMGCNVTYEWFGFAVPNIATAEFDFFASASINSVDAIITDNPLPSGSAPVGASGDWSIAAVTTPEPSTAPPMLAGLGVLGLLVVIRKRVALRQSLAD
jgi:MYXO-CTERM domain-containing protein